jgi:3-hydroxyisobutyrate dehydrogenase-like beta-hydroxyacid dehydrogenase
MVNAIPLLVDEALALGVKAGISAEKLYEIWNVSSSSRFVQGVPNLLRRNFDNPSFTLALSAKDVGLAAEAGRESGVPMHVTSAAAQVLTRAVTEGHGAKSPAAVVLTIEEGAGVKIE